MSAYHSRRRRSEELQEKLLEIGTEWYRPKSESRGSCSQQCRNCFSLFLEKGNVCLLVSLLIGVAGIFVRIFAAGNCLDGLARSTNESCSDSVVELGRFFIAAGLFGFAGGFTNWLAILMIFYRIPLVYGSGIIPNRYKKIGESVKEVIMNAFFDKIFLDKFMEQKISQWMTTHETGKHLETILESTEIEKILDEKLKQLYEDNTGEVLKAINLDKDTLKPMVQPFLLGVSADITPALTRKLAGKKGSAVQWLNRELDIYMTLRLKELTKEKVTALLKQVIGKHLGWIVVWGTVFGGLIGIVCQAAHISPEY